MARSQWPAGPRWRAERPGAALAGTLAVAALALAGCGAAAATEAGNVSGTSGGAAGSGSASATSARPLPAGHLLCARPAAASRVVIAVTDYPRTIAPAQPGRVAAPAKPAEPLKPSRPARPAAARPTAVIPRPQPAIVKVVTSAARARALARGLCGLPRMPRGPLRCPALFAGSYQLTFTAAGRKLPVVSIQLTGCQAVTGAGPVRSAATRPAFWALLARIAGRVTPLPVHLPGGPVSPGTPFGPVSPGLSGCEPPTVRTHPGPPVRACPGPDRPVVSTSR
jgi:hypothetical protein